jgi:malate dehydrogenase
MIEVAIVGAGELGGALMHGLARRHAVRAITLIDDNSSAARGKALDITQAGAVESFSTTLTGSADLVRAAGASIVILADRFGGAEWSGDQALGLLQRLIHLAPRAAIVCAGAMQRELIETGVRELKADRRRLFGTAPGALGAGAQALIALALDRSPRDVRVAVLGVPPSHIVVGWEDGTAGGHPLTGLIAQPVRRQLVARIRALWPPGSHALAAAAVQAIQSMTGKSRSLATCFVAPETAAGTRTRTAALPVRLGPLGVRDVVEPVLSAGERVALESALDSSLKSQV